MKSTAIGSAFVLTASAFLALTAATACGGSTAPAEDPAAPAPADEPDDLDVATAPQSESDAAPSEPAESAGPTESQEPAEPVSKLTYERALQAMLSDYALIDALKLNQSGRIPLKVAGEGIPQNLAVYVDQRAIEVVDVPDEQEGKAILIINRIELSEDRGKFRYRYPAERVAGTSRVGPGDGKWILLSSRISKY